MNNDVVRALLAVFESGLLNSQQAAAIHQVRVLIGDAEGLGCAHENTAYEANDALVCQDCRETLNAVVETVAAAATIEAPAVEVELPPAAVEERKVRCPSCHRYTSVPFGTTDYACSHCGEKLEITA